MEMAMTSSNGFALLAILVGIFGAFEDPTAAFAKAEAADGGGAEQGFASQSSIGSSD